MTQTPRIFINYRTGDTGPSASALFRDLEQRLGEDIVFIDHDRIEGGAQWPARLRDEVESATAMLCLIGRGWLNASDASGTRRRLDWPDDWVRLEIERALERGITVIPVLVDGAVLPSARDLPDGLAALVTRQWRPLRHVEWKTDVARLIDDMEIPERHTDVAATLGPVVSTMRQRLLRPG